MSADIIQINSVKWNKAKEVLPPFGILVTIRWRQKMKDLYDGNVAMCFAVLELYGESLLRWNVGGERKMQMHPEDEWMES